MVATLRYLFVKYYYLLFVLVGFTQMIRVPGGWTIISYLSFLFVLTAFWNIKYKFCDVLVLFFIGYSLLTYPLFGDYPSDIYIATIRDQIFPISFYFFARNNKTKNVDIFEKAIYPLMFAFLLGFLLFFTSPGWYIEYRLDGEYNQSVRNYFNLTRMSSFWSSSYCVGYSSLFVIMYTINRSVFDNQKIKFFGIILGISFMALFFAQQRISMGFVALYLFVISLVLLKKGKISTKKFVIYLVGVLMLISFIAFMVLNYMDKDYVDYILERFTENDDGIIEDRVNMFTDYVETITFFGEGLGKYGHNALLFHDMPCISDCEYIRTPNEIGIFGMSIFIMLVLSSLIYNYSKGRKYSFESFCVVFYLLAMVGATPLEVSQHQPFILWYCLGKMQNK